MPTKPVKCYLSKEQREILLKICEKLGLDESEALRYIFLEYAHSINLIKNAVHKGE